MLAIPQPLPWTTEVRRICLGSLPDQKNILLILHSPPFFLRDPITLATHLQQALNDFHILILWVSSGAVSPPWEQLFVWPLSNPPEPNVIFWIHFTSSVILEFLDTLLIILGNSRKYSVVPTWSIRFFQHILLSRNWSTSRQPSLGSQIHFPIFLSQKLSMFPPPGPDWAGQSSTMDSDLAALTGRAGSFDTVTMVVGSIPLKWECFCLKILLIIFRQTAVKPGQHPLTWIPFSTSLSPVLASCCAMTCSFTRFSFSFHFLYQHT